jgi:hypothetical protein
MTGTNASRVSAAKEHLSPALGTAMVRANFALARLPPRAGRQ